MYTASEKWNLESYVSNNKSKILILVGTNQTYLKKQCLNGIF